MMVLNTTRDHRLPLGVARLLLNEVGIGLGWEVGREGGTEAGDLLG